MKKTPTFPVTVKRGSVSTKIYCFKRADKRDVFTVAWHAGGTRLTRQFKEYADAYAEASLKAEQLAAGRLGAASSMSSDDAAALTEARKLCGDVPLMAAVQEWARARRITNNSILTAAEFWARRNARKFQRITVATAIDRFIDAKTRAGKQGERVYRAKLKPLIEYFPKTYIDEITSNQLTAYLERWQDGVTRNDMRKRAVALWRWALRSGHLPRGVPLESEQTERADEEATDIGIITPETYEGLLKFFHKNHPQHLAALVLAGFCGIRSDEIHGKRADLTKRQLWSDIYLERKFLRVTVAKENTPAWRHVPICEAAIDWLELCPERTGPVCEIGAMWKVRRLAIAAKFELPDNCFRHSFISYRIQVLQNKDQVALEAGNSVKEIDRRYRRPVEEDDAQEWFKVCPEEPDDLPGRISLKKLLKSERYKRWEAQGGIAPQDMIPG